MNNKKYAEDKIKELNELTGYKFDIHYTGQNQSIKDDRRTFAMLRSRDLDVLGSNVDDVITLIKEALKLKGIEV